MLFYVFLLGLMVRIEAMIVPLYYDLRDLKLTNTYWALILPQIGTLGRVRVPSGRACSSAASRARWRWPRDWTARRRWCRVQQRPD